MPHPCSHSLSVILPCIHFLFTVLSFILSTPVFIFFPSLSSFYNFYSLRIPIFSFLLFSFSSYTPIFFPLHLFSLLSSFYMPLFIRFAFVSTFFPSSLPLSSHFFFPPLASLTSYPCPFFTFPSRTQQPRCGSSCSFLPHASFSHKIIVIIWKKVILLIQGINTMNKCN